MRQSTLLLSLCLFLGVLATSTAQDEGTVAQVKTWFPDHPSLEFLPGKLVTTVFGVRNPGDVAFNVSAAVGNLALVSNPEGNIFNFSGISLSVPQLDKGDEVVVEYPFMLPVNLPPRDFILQIKLLMTQNGLFSTQLVFNETVSIVEGYKLIDTELVGLYVIFLFGLAAAVYGAYSMALNQGWVKKPRKSKASGASAGMVDRSEWLRGTVADTSKKAAGKQN